jgi:hypothetical protein
MEGTGPTGEIAYAVDSFTHRVGDLPDDGDARSTDFSAGWLRKERG